MSQIDWPELKMGGDPVVLAVPVMLKYALDAEPIEVVDKATDKLVDPWEIVNCLLLAV
ncbi:hypothetical protein [Adlercreutzia mucosicola]|uniref:hypothetical protein n=1 Tax=Adlercreutzia mucosicola TaxID=580026 RepID=UPI002B254CAA|nr:hypothetical protein [Adlercreutzia mucosicola]MEB1813369.1 hypothetical protein [Adlercreutzia mucosicola]